ncbi:MAG TPA: hypothetical protein VES67_17205 [Vicinamibacterales bacterium]|nr:hypothetical protein [Vicinamibacterales bacterium]
MTAKTAAAIASVVVVALASAGCLSFYEIAVETPIQAKLDVTPFQRVLIAGFLGGGSKSIDPNTETARLLRSQLRTKSELKVIDADVMTLVDEVDRRRAGGGSAPAADSSDDPKIKNEKDLQEYEKIFADVDFWKKLGEEYQGPLIVTGSVLFTEVAKSGMVSRAQPFIDQTGITRYVEQRQFSNMKGFALTPKFVFIDGRTGAQLYSESFHEEALYQENQNTPALSSYFELMDKLLPGFLNTLSTQKIKGTRILLK